MAEDGLWVGLDVGETSTSICVLSSEPLPVLECAVASGAAEIAATLSRFVPTAIRSVVMETGAAPHLARQLILSGLPVQLLDAAKVHRFLSIRMNKTDENDARGLAEVARLGSPGHLVVRVRSPECQQLREQLVIRSQLLRLRTATRNSLRSMLRNNGSHIRQITVGNKLRSQVETEFEAIQTAVGRRISDTMTPLLDICESLTFHLTKFDKLIANMAAENPVTSRFMQIPGVGPVCAVSFFAAIEEPDRFIRTTDVGAYLGMTPRIRQSGTKVQRSRITRAGSAMTRGHLVMAAGVMLSRAADGCAIRDWGWSLRVRIGYGKARMAVARKIATTMLSLWKSGKDFEPYPGRA